MFTQIGVLALLVSCTLAVPVKDGRVHLDGPLPPAMLQPKVDINPVIIGGKDVDPAGKYPWQVSLQYLGGHTCGGSIMDENYIITAAHCVTRSMSFYSVIAGLHNQKKQSDNTQKSNVLKFYTHEDYLKGDGNYPNDIALIKLATPLTFNDNVKPIPLDENGDYGVGSECIISGWGYYDRKGFQWVMPDILQEAPTEVISNDDCKNAWGSRSINPGHVCILSNDRDTSACMGDSGGPLHCRNSQSEDWHLVGATSWGSSSCATSMPGAYSRISYFMSWIRKTRGY